MEFKAEFVNGQVVVKPIVEKNGKDIKIHVPSLKLIKELKEKIKDGKRDIQ